MSSTRSEESPRLAGGGFNQICLVQIITKLELGGAQKIVLSILKGISSDDVVQFLITGEGGLLTDEAQRIQGIKCIVISDLVREIHPLKDIYAFFEMYRRLKQIKRSLGPSTCLTVHTHSSKAGILGRWAAWFAGADSILHTFHGFGFHDFQPALKREFFIFLERWTSKITDKIIGVSGSNIEKGRSLRVFGQEQTEFIPYGIHLSNFHNLKVDRHRKREELGLPFQGPLVGMVACFKPQKAPLDFIEMAAHVGKKIPDAGFVMVGDGALRSQIERRIEDLQLKDKIFLLGWRNDIPEILGVLDVFVLTSLWEGLPIVFLEAMASGLPIVATRVDGAPEVIKDGVNGFLVAPHDIQAMSRRIIQLVQNPDQARHFGIQGAKRVDSFDIEKMIRTYRSLYLNLGLRKF